MYKWLKKNTVSKAYNYNNRLWDLSFFTLYVLELAIWFIFNLQRENRVTLCTAICTYINWRWYSLCVHAEHNSVTYLNHGCKVGSEAVRSMLVPHSQSVGLASPFPMRWAFIDPLTISSQGRSPAWQPRSFWSQLYNINYWTTFSAHRYMTRQGCTISGHIQCTQKHEKTWLYIFFWQVGWAHCTLTSICPEHLLHLATCEQEKIGF